MNKVIGSGFIYQKDQDLYDFAQENGGVAKVLSLGLEGIEEKLNAFIRRKDD